MRCVCVYALFIFSRFWLKIVSKAVLRKSGNWCSEQSPQRWSLIHLFQCAQEYDAMNVRECQRKPVNAVNFLTVSSFYVWHHHWVDLHIRNIEFACICRISTPNFSMTMMMMMIVVQKRNVNNFGCCFQFIVTYICAHEHKCRMGHAKRASQKYILFTIEIVVWVQSMRIKTWF